MNKKIFYIIPVVFVIGFVVFGYQSGNTNQNNFSPKDFDEKLIEQYVFDLTNQKRIENGISVLEWDEELYKIAKNHSVDMAESDFTTHINLEGLSANDRAMNANYHCFKEDDKFEYDGISENIAVIGSEDENNEREIAEEIIDGFMSSKDHKSNLLHPINSKIGLGISISGFAVYTTQNFC